MIVFSMRKARTWKEHMELLEYLTDHPIKSASTQFHISEPAVRSWLYRLTNQIAETQAALNRIRNLQSRSARIRKLTTKGTIPKEEEENE